MGILKLSEVLRLDKWLWRARFFKSRSLASTICQSSKVRVNGNTISKAHYPVKFNDVLTFTKGSSIKVIRILKLGLRRGPASEARTLYEDLSPSLKLEERNNQALVTVAKRASGSGRPTKNQRRAIDRLMAKGKH